MRFAARSVTVMVIGSIGFAAVTTHYAIYKSCWHLRPSKDRKAAGEVKC
jgi:hypothetical protein